jgi:hypothetical protein
MIINNNIDPKQVPQIRSVTHPQEITYNVYMTWKYTLIYLIGFIIIFYALFQLKQVSVMSAVFHNHLNYNKLYFEEF